MKTRTRRCAGKQSFTLNGALRFINDHHRSTRFQEYKCRCGRYHVVYVGPVDHRGVAR